MNKLVFCLEPEQSIQLIAGVDEVGRGPLAADVVAAAVILDPANPIPGLNDSKKLSEKKREALFPLIQQHAIAYAIGRASPEEIDQINILQASLLAMKRAVEGLNIAPDYIYVDGNKIPQWRVPCPCSAVVKGDSKILSIAAASILAKVTRDTELLALDKQYPGYGLAQHKGYPTQLHMEALKRLGPSPIHRKSFKPVAELINADLER